MKIQDFEKAIEALNCAIDIDEFKMKGREVRRCIANTEQMRLEWDEFGRAFTVPSNQEPEEFIDSITGLVVTGRRLIRCVDFDLKFD